MSPPKLHYRDVAPLPPEGPLDLESLIPGQGDIELDIGFGRGSSVFARAAVAPAARIYGIEIRSKWATKVEERRSRLKLANVRIFCGDAREISARSGPAGCVSRVSVHFPDPWWKKRHEKRRLVSAPFLDELARLLRERGQFLVQTDVPERAALYRSLLSEHRAFEAVQHEIAGVDGDLGVNAFAAPSNRELRAIEDGLPIHRILATRGRSVPADAEGRERDPRQRERDE